MATGVVKWFSDAKGYGIAQFIERFGPPNKYTGSFVNRADGKRFTFESFRVRNRSFLADFEVDKLKETTIRKYLAEEIRDHQNMVQKIASSIAS